MKLLFLDIDGVLNGHQFMAEAASCSIDKACIARLNRIVRITGCKVVLSSAWRYMILGGSMTLGGFGYMLRTHGFSHADSLVGHTCADEDVFERSEQIKKYLEGHPCDCYIAVDDLALQGICAHQTDGEEGLTDEDVEQIIAVLGAEEVALT